ncbi:hypothetical protein AG1IA_10214 [Rhizoctonia solani AG-1 IA]|uniref:Uncharacterized protein n=1 Tax=Thanatephorus cucumeris (strain AG1-IA) TaxID=983506 RepID=L8WC61_THACA|nr:hypothetical protein AG1IA_10214 [Rhizoctonia solani AG-1 IA]
MFYSKTERVHSEIKANLQFRGGSGKDQLTGYMTNEWYYARKSETKVAMTWNIDGAAKQRSKRESATNNPDIRCARDRVRCVATHNSRS